MLVVSRNSNESINIGDEVQIRVVRVAGGRVWLGIDAPRKVRVVRHEIQEPGTPAPRPERPPARSFRPE